MFGDGEDFSISGASDTFLSGTSNGQVLSYNSSTSKWTNSTPASGSGVPGTVYFDTYFAGANDDAKIAAMNTFHQGIDAQSIHPAVLFGNRQYVFSTPIKLYSGMNLVGTKFSNAHGDNTGTVLYYTGGSGTAMFAYPGSQTNQSYPTDGSPRDVYVGNMQLRGLSNTHCIQKYDPVNDSSTGKVIWYSRFHDCAFTNFSTIWWGLGDGMVIDGATDIAAIGDTAIYAGGSECIIFGSDTYSQMNAQDNGVPQIRSLLAKSSIGKCMITARKTGWALSIEGGHNMLIDGLMIDAQNSDPMYGAGMKIKSVDALTVTNCSFKGVATAPASAIGGAAGNKGWIHITSGSQITFSGNMFRREGTNLPATTYPLIYATGVGSGQVKWGYNGWSGWSGAGATIQQSSSNMITALTDPNLTVSVG